jgi:hypothetical protein
MRSELAVALNELIIRPRSRGWFFPVLLSQFSIPDIDIGFGEALEDIQWADLAEDFESGVQILIRAIGRALDLSINDEIDGWRRFNWITSGPVVEARVRSTEEGWLIAAPERTYNGLFGMCSRLHCISSLALEFLLERPTEHSIGYGLGIVPRGSVDSGTPYGCCFEIGWDGRYGHHVLNTTMLPDGPWHREDDSPVEIPGPLENIWLSIEFRLSESVTRIRVGEQHSDHPALAAEGVVLIRAWGSTVRLRNLTIDSD